MCEIKDNEIALLKDDMDTLTDYGVEVRYPDNFFIPSLSEAIEAFELAQKTRDYVKNKIGNLTPSILR